MHAYRKNNDTPGDDEMLTFKEAGAHIGVPLPGIYWLIQLGYFPAINVAGRIRLSRKYLDTEVIPKITIRSKGFPDLESWIAAEHREMQP